MSMDNKGLYIFQSWISLLIHSGMIWVNIDMGWASVPALWWTGHMIIFYELFDVMLGWEGYLKNDRLMLVHHGVALVGGMLLLTFIGDSGDDVHDNNFKLATLDTAKWMLLSEMTTIFNSVRIITSHHGKLLAKVFKFNVALVFRGLFAIAFIVLRSVQTIGVLGVCLYWRGLDKMWMGWTLWTIFTVMNGFWIVSIVRTMRMRLGSGVGSEAGVGSAAGGGATGTVKVD